MVKRLTTAAITCVALIAPMAQADGVFDFLDPCIEAKKDFQDNVTQTYAAYDAEIAATTYEKAPAEYRQKVWAELKVNLRNEFEKSPEAGLLKKHGVDLNKAFIDWYTMVLKEIGGEATVNVEIDKVYREEKIKALKTARAKTDSQVEEVKRDLDSNCKSDVANQTLRVAVTTLFRPVDIVVGNFAAAKRENGLFNQAVRASTGISIKDIKEYGILGGPNSDARKVQDKIRGTSTWVGDRLGIRFDTGWRF